MGNIDYKTAPLIEITDYKDLFNPANDPITLAISLTGERDIRCWGHWVKMLNAASKMYGGDIATNKFRMILSDVFGEWRAGEITKPGAILNGRLAQAWPLVVKQLAKPDRGRP